MPRRKIVITGGAGFVGSHVAGTLADEGKYLIAVCDRFGAGDKWKNVSKHPIHTIIAPDDLFYWLEMHAEDVEAIVHMGAITSTTENDADMLLEHNFALSTMLWRWCAEQEKRFIYASSASTYGSGEQGFDDDVSIEYLKKLRPLNPYAWSKQLFDQHVSGIVSRGEIKPAQWAGLKFFNVYGPNEYHKGEQKSVICKFTPHAAHGQTLKLFKSYHPDYKHGGQKRDFIHVKDCTAIISWLLETPAVNGLFNVGTGQARSFDEVAHAIFAALGRNPQIAYVDMPEDIIHHYQYFTEAKLDRLRAAGYAAPFTSLEDGVRDYVQNYLTKDDPYF